MRNIKELIYCLLFVFLSVNRCHAGKAVYGDSLLTGVNFRMGLDWRQILDLAKKENKFIFLDCYASWCAPCKAMERNIYSSKEVGDSMNERFICVKVQMDTSRQDSKEVQRWYKDAHRIMEEYRPSAYPTYLFFSPKGSIVHRDIGYKNINKFMSLAEDALNPDKQYYTWLNKFQRNQLGLKGLRAFVFISESIGEKDEAYKVANKYIEMLSDKELYSMDNLEFMYAHTRNVRDKGFTFFLTDGKNLAYFDKLMTENRIKDKIENVIYEDEIKPFANSLHGMADWKRIKSNVEKFGSIGWEAYEKHRPRIVYNNIIMPKLKSDRFWPDIFDLIKKQNCGKGEEFLIGSTIVYYINNRLLNGDSSNFTDFADATKYYSEHYSPFLRPGALNAWGWIYFMYATDRKRLDLALAWGKRAIDSMPEPVGAYFDTYANILYKLNRTAEAIEWEEKAVALAPKESSFSDALKKMKNKQPTWD